MHATLMPGTYRGQIRTLDPLEINLEMVMNHHMGSGKQIYVLFRSDKYSWPLSHLSSPRQTAHFNEEIEHIRTWSYTVALQFMSWTSLDNLHLILSASVSKTMYRHFVFNRLAVTNGFCIFCLILRVIQFHRIAFLKLKKKKWAMTVSLNRNWTVWNVLACDRRGSS